MGVKQRLISFLKHVNVSQSKFEELVGLSNGFVNNIGDSIRVKSLNKISSSYPDLNTAWLLTGEGEMLLSETKTGTDTEKELMRKRIQDLETIVELQKKIIDSKSEPEKQSMPSEKPEKLKKAN